MNRDLHAAYYQLLIYLFCLYIHILTLILILKIVHVLVEYVDI